MRRLGYNFFSYRYKTALDRLDQTDAAVLGHLPGHEPIQPLLPFRSQGHGESLLWECDRSGVVRRDRPQFSTLSHLLVLWCAENTDMNTQRFAIVVTTINLAVLTLVFTQNLSANAPSTSPVLRGSALEIVDDKGLVCASITLHGSTIVDGKKYPEAVVFRLIDPKNGPIVKIDASEEGSGLGISDDSTEGGVRLMAKNRTGTFLQVTDKDGKKRFVRP